MSLSQITMQASAAMLGVTGLLLLFMPDVSAGMLGLSASPLVEMAGAGAIGLAIVDWTARSAPVGGIYGRPIVLGNLAFGICTAGTLLRLAFEPDAAAPLIAVTVVFLVYAAAFGRLLFRGPTERASA